MIKIEIYEDTGQFIANGAAIELLKEEEYQQIDELAKKLKVASRTERQALNMKAIDTYKKCLCCGMKYQVGADRKKCVCGGHLYVVTQYEQRKVNCAGARR